MDTPRTVLITGCSSGIGRRAAEIMQARGWRVFASARRPESVAELRQAGFGDALQLDLDDSDSIARAVETVLERSGGRLDALFNNGAYAIPGAVEDLSRDALRDIFETNVFGQIALANRLLPVMRAQGHGRIIHNSSVLGFISTPFRGSYCASKFALEALTDAQRMEHRGTDIHFILIEPGPIPTDFRKNAAIQFEKWIDVENAHRREFYETTVRKRLYDTSGKPDLFELPSSAVTKKLIHALESRNPKPRYMVTTATYISNVLRRILPTRLLDGFLARQ